MEPIKLWDHQRRIMDIAVPLGKYGIFADPGTGKTRTSIEILRRWYAKEKRVINTVIICPGIVVENWRREFFQFSKVGKYVRCLIGTGKQRAELAKTAPSGSILITNFESLLMPAVFQALEAYNPTVFIVDEVHRAKNLSAKRTKQAIKLADQAKYKLILTGSPILNTPLDLFAQFRILDSDTFGRNYFVFRATYFYDKNAGMPKAKHFPLWLPRPGAIEELNKKIKPVSMVVKKADCLDLPPLVKQTVFVELSKEQQRLYNEMKKDFIAYVSGKACVANLAITKALRLQQIVSGFITLEGENGEDRTNVSLKDNPRAEALKELLADIAPNAKCIVWAVFKQNYEVVRRVCAALSIDYVEIHGEIPAAARQKAVDRFNTDPTCRVLLGHPQSAGIGVNLVSASYSIFYSRTFSLENDLQAEARNYRGGSEIHDKVTRIDLVAKDTIDELISAKLADKMEVSETVLRDIAGQL